MIQEINTKDFIYFQFSIGCYCFLAFSLSDLLNSLPSELKNQVLTQLN